ncbi:MAG TPA: redoxin domain-containing protein [Candidatus Methylomirabilis sp.]|nr:redoxin domain-containing protein [Candidatus Methylomirabilis sp.]
MNGRALTIVIGLLLASPVPARDIRAFEPGSLAAIEAAHAGRSFILAFWSINCTHCPEDLALFADLRRRYPDLDIVLVSVDSPEDAETISATLERYHLENVEARVFADEFTERLRFEIDRQWHGELPRTYFYGADRTVRGVSGRLDARAVTRWIERQRHRMAKEK